MIRRPPRSTQSRSSAASDVYKRQEQCWSAQAKTGRAYAEERVGLGGQVQVRDLFVSSDIEGPNDDWLAAKRSENRAVCFDLLFLGGWAVTVEEQELRAIQADPVRAEPQGRGDVSRAADVGRNFNMLAVPEGYFLILVLSQEILFCCKGAGALFEGRALLGGGVQNNRSGGSVDAQACVFVNACKRCAQTDNGGKAECLSKDGRMACCATLFCHKAQHILAVDGCGIRWSKVTRNDDRRVRQDAQVGLGHPQQSTDHAIPNIPDIFGPLTEVGVGQIVHKLGTVLIGTVYCCCGAVSFSRIPFHGLLQRRVVQEHLIGGEDLGFLALALLFHTCVQRFDLMMDALVCQTDRLEFLLPGDGVVRFEIQDDVVRAVDIHSTDGDAC